MFANQYKALDDMPEELRARLDGKKAIHSAARGYAKDGLYGKGDSGDRSMDIRSSDAALATHTHDIIREHPETGKQAIFSSAAYITGFEDMEEEASAELLMDLYRWQTRPEFQYRHKWQPNMLVMWDNRALLHMATGGYAGHDRLLHRTTIGDRDTH